MLIHPLWPNGPTIPPLGAGAWQWGDRLIWGFGGAYNANDAHQAFLASLASGVSLIDTAEIYGSGASERLIGRFLRSVNTPVTIATKFMPFPWRLRRHSLVNALRGSLRRLGVEKVALYQLHQPLPPVPIETWMDAMADAVDLGLTDAAGISNCGADLTRRAHAALAKRGIPLATNQIHYSLLHRNPERDGLLETCRELGVTVLAYSPLEQGLLTGKYSLEHVPSGYRRIGAAGKLRRGAPLLRAMREIADDRGATMAQVALNWLMAKGTAPLPGAKNAEQARQNAESLGWRLTDAQVQQLDQLSAA